MFDQSNIDSVTAAPDGLDLLVAWESSEPAGTLFQVYLDHRLTWSGFERSVHVPLPQGRNVQIAVGAVGDDEGEADFSGSLDPLSPTVKTLRWEGGTFLASDIAGFNVYRADSAGGAVNYGRIFRTIPAYPGGIVTDGYGMGGYGRGGYGRSANDYQCETPDLSNGSWAFGVKPVDQVGNEGAAATTTVVIDAPPRPPAADSRGRRLRYSYDPDTQIATLTWSASPA